MELRIWTYDLAREQQADLDFLRELCRQTIASGYNALGLYLEHRFAYESAPWTSGKHALTKAEVQTLEREFPTLQIVPFINLLGHFEGMLYTEKGHTMAAERFRGLQADGVNPDFQALCRSLIDDVCDAFRSDLIHIGGDETAQLGVGPYSSKRLQEIQAENPSTDAKAQLYAEHFAPLSDYLVAKGRTPGVWGDMFFEHPDALNAFPKETVIFDWQYFKSSEFTAKPFLDAGYRTVFCPAIHTYNAIWCHLAQSERSVAEQVEAAHRLGAYGVCVTTWECGLFGNYSSILPAIRAAGKMLLDPRPEDRGEPLANGTFEKDVAIYAAKPNEAPRFLKEYLAESEADEEIARLLGIELQNLGGIYKFTRLRHPLKCRLFLYANPFLAWLRHREDLAGDLLPATDFFTPDEIGLKAIQIAERAVIFANKPHWKGLYMLTRKSAEFVRFAERARQAYAAGRPGEAITHLSPCRQVFEDLERVAVATSLNSAGSLADVERCRIARRHVEEVILRIKAYGDGSLGYLPSFETITHHAFCPHDQGNWWLINRWALE